MSAAAKRRKRTREADGRCVQVGEGRGGSRKSTGVKSVNEVCRKTVWREIRVRKLEMRPKTGDGGSIRGTDRRAAQARREENAGKSCKCSRRRDRARRHARFSDSSTRPLRDSGYSFASPPPSPDERGEEEAIFRFIIGGALSSLAAPPCYHVT